MTRARVTHSAHRRARPAQPFSLPRTACHGTRMADQASERLAPQAALVLIRRLVTEYGLKQWKRYVVAFALMGVGALCTAFVAYMIKDVVNEAYVQRNFPGVLEVAILT